MSDDKKPNEMKMPADTQPSAGTAPTMVTSEVGIEAITIAYAERLRAIKAIANEPAADAVAAGRVLERVVAACERELEPVADFPRDVRITLVKPDGTEEVTERGGVLQSD